MIICVFPYTKCHDINFIEHSLLQCCDARVRIAHAHLTLYVMYMDRTRLQTFQILFSGKSGPSTIVDPGGKKKNKNNK